MSLDGTTGLEIVPNENGAPHLAAQGWVPILREELAQQAQRAITDIAAELPPFWSGIHHTIMEDGRLVEVPVRNPALASGTSGLALFYAYLGQSLGDESATSLAEAYLHDAFAAVPQFPFPKDACLFDGFLGVAWVLNHLQALGALRESDTLDEIDSVLLKGVSSEWGAGYDLVNGLVGVGIYAIDRLPRPAAVICLDRVVALLEARSTRFAKGSAWPTTSPPWGAVTFRRKFTGPYLDLGVAHGIAGVIGFLSRVALLGMLSASGRELLERAMSWFLSQVTSRHHAGNVPSAVSIDDNVRTPGRLAWCYGAPGVVSPMLAASQALGRVDWERAAIELGESVARSVVTSEDLDPALCHGVAGLGHLFARLYNVTGNSVFQIAARRSFERLVQLRTPGTGIGGYVCIIPDPGQPDRHEPSKAPGFLNGVAGIGLALLGATSDVRPEWDRVLLADPSCK